MRRLSSPVPAGERSSGVLYTRPRCYHNESMRNILVRGVPDEVHAALAGRAERRAQSLQQYLLGELERLAGRPTLDEVLDRIERRRGGRVALSDAVADVAGERAAR